ncbi:hypothetical protein EJB05_40807, partial [Eragrostis curvula]
MAGTAISIARSILGSAISKAASAAAEEMSLLMGVWVEQVRSLSYDIEDCFDEFMVHVGSQSLSQLLMKLKDRHRIAVQIRNLKSRVEEVSSRNTRYNLITTKAANIDDEAHSYMEDVRSHSARNIDEAELVGFSNLKKELLDMINAQHSDGQAQVICVVGMGGLGKTTLVRKIYETKDAIENNFAYCAWITVSQSFSRIEVLQDMIRKLFGDDSLKACLKKLEGKATVHVQVDHLGKYLVERLTEKRYFIVLDDVWNIDAWIWIRDICLPSINNRSSRIVITTRDVSVAEACTTKSASMPFILELKPLEKEHSTDLLLRKMRKSKQDIENDENLMTIVTKLVAKCGGLPLAIVTIGAMFATKRISEWDKLCEQLPSELENNLSLEAIRTMVILSYTHLPSYLKPCFLYLSIFPEDFKIRRSHLVDRWIAEGLIRARVGMTLEDVGKRYFKELISRSMIQPSRVNIEGVVKCCRVHDIIRDIIVMLSREEGFVYTSPDNVPSLMEESFRHIAYHGNKISTVGMDWCHVRSLTFFGKRPIEHAPSFCSPQLRMLRALDLENADFKVTQKDLKRIVLLRHLKYIKISHGRSYIYALPRSIGKLHGLQVLDMRGGYISTLPTQICKLQSLRVIRCRSKEYYMNFDLDEPLECLMCSLCLPMTLTSVCGSEMRNEVIAELRMAYSKCWSNTEGVKVPRGIGNLKELQTLEMVDIKRTSGKAIRELGELSKLRKLIVNTEGATEKKCMTLCKAIQKLSFLCSLQIEAGYNGTVEWLDSVSSPPPLRTLVLSGRIGDKVEWFTNLTLLVKLRLYWSQLKEGKAVEILGALPNLMLLQLKFEALVRMEFVFRQDAFLNLRQLDISMMDKLREIRFEQDASPKMETIEIEECRLELGINGIKNLPNLKEISLGNRSAVARLGMLEEEVRTHPNQPVLRLTGDRSELDLGDVGGSDEYFDAMESLPDHDGEGAESITPSASDKSVLRGRSSQYFLRNQ